MVLRLPDQLQWIIFSSGAPLLYFQFKKALAISIQRGDSAHG
jgi:hypothetical protein